MKKNSQLFGIGLRIAAILALVGCSPVNLQQEFSSTEPAPTLAVEAPTATLAHIAGDPSQIPAATANAPLVPDAISGQKVTFRRGGLTLVGYLYKPAGLGPFPAIIWNHGSEQNPGPPSQEFPAIAQVFVPAGYVVFAPEREGQGESQGQNIDDQVKAEAKLSGRVPAEQLFVRLMAGPQLDDQLAGEAYLTGLPYVDMNRLAVVGCSYGGIQTLLAAERGAGFKAAVAESPGAESWAGNTVLQHRLIQAVDNINIPVFLLHPENDASVLPGYVLGQEFAKLGKPYQLEVYGPYGTDAQQGHCFGGGQGTAIWAPEVLRFLAAFDK